MTENVNAMVNAMIVGAGDKLTLSPSMFADLVQSATAHAMHDHKMGLTVRGMTLDEATSSISEHEDFYRNVMRRLAPKIRSLFWIVPAEADVHISPRAREAAQTKLFLLIQFAIHEYQQADRQAERVSA